MSELRSTEQRKADVLAALEKNPDFWLATASPSGRPHIIVVAGWWDGAALVIATIGSSLTAHNLDSTHTARLALGSPDDVVMIDADVAHTVPAAEADAALADGFRAAAGWDPREEEGGWRFFRLTPTRIQAYRGYGEQEGRDVMRGAAWLA